ncbi:helix-turn-helix domain-containing protein [Flavobacterium sp. 3-210]
MISIFSACVAVVIIICVLVSILLIGYSKKTKKYNILLSLFFLLLSYPCFILFLINTGFIKYMPHVYRTGIIAHLLYMPASYLYIRSVVSNKGLTKIDFIHLIPALIYIVDYFPFFWLPGSEKIAFMQSKQLSKMVLYFYESRFFIPGFYIVFKYVLAFTYWIFQSILLIRLYKVKNSDFKKENGVWLKWLTIFLLSQIFLFLPSIHILKPGGGDDELTVFLFIGGFTGLTAVFLFLFPQILYGIKGMVLLDKSALTPGISDNVSSFVIEDDQQRQSNYRYLSQAKMEEIAIKIRTHIITHKSFLNKQYTLQQLALELSIPAQYISAVINKCEKINFNDFINTYRVKYCLELLNNNDHDNQTLEAISAQSGFNNRNTFTMAFKKIVGQTPSAYIKTIAKFE